MTCVPRSQKSFWTRCIENNTPLLRVQAAFTEKNSSHQLCLRLNQVLHGTSHARCGSKLSEFHPCVSRHVQPRYAPHLHRPSSPKPIRPLGAGWIRWCFMMLWGLKGEVTIWESIKTWNFFVGPIINSTVMSRQIGSQASCSWCTQLGSARPRFTSSRVFRRTGLRSSGLPFVELRCSIARTSTVACNNSVSNCALQN